MENAEGRAYRNIISEILTGAYQPGDFLLELDIAPKLKMSRTPVSRALARLVSEGFLNKKPKKGCYIPIPTPDDAENIFTARQLAEGEAVALTAKHINENEINLLEKIISKDIIAMEKKDKETWASVNEDFHLLIARLCDNPYIEKWARNMFWRSNVYIFYFDQFYKPTDVNIVHETPKQHANILMAIKKGDSDLARELMKQHIRTTYIKLLIN